MKTNAMFGLMALMALASIAMARPVDYNSYVQCGASIRYLGGPSAGYEIGGGVFSFPSGVPGEYEIVQLYSPMALATAPNDCPRTNGVPICPSF